MNILAFLIKIANHLDAIGHTNLADDIDRVLKDQLIQELIRLDAKEKWFLEQKEHGKGSAKPFTEQDSKRKKELEEILDKMPWSPRTTPSGWWEPDMFLAEDIKNNPNFPVKEPHIPITSIPAGTILYHGTYGDIKFEMLNERSHLTPVEKMAWEYAIEEGNGVNPRVLVFETTAIPNLIAIPSILDRENFDAAIWWLENKFKVDFSGLGSRRIPDAFKAICNAGYNGFFMKADIIGDPDILLCSPANFLTLKEVKKFQP